MFDRAKAYCGLEAAAAVVQMWLANRQRIGGWFASGEWLVSALARLNAFLGRSLPMSDSLIERLAEMLREWHRTGTTPGVVPVRWLATAA
jgi:hypothetical protein